MTGIAWSESLNVTDPRTREAFRYPMKVECFATDNPRFDHRPCISC